MLDLSRQAAIAVPEPGLARWFTDQCSALPEVFQGLVGQRVQAASRDVLIELAVPGRGVKLGEPGAERSQSWSGSLRMASSISGTVHILVAYHSRQIQAMGPAAELHNSAHPFAFADHSSSFG